MGDFFMEKNKKYIYAAVVIFGVFLSMRYLVPIMAPLLIAALIVIPTYPWLTKISAKIKIGKAILAGIFMTVIGLIAGSALWGISTYVLNKIKYYIMNIDLYEDKFCLFIKDCSKNLENSIGISAMEIETLILERVDIFVENMKIEVLPQLMNESYIYVKSVIGIVTFIAITFIAVILLAKDYGKMIESIKRQSFFSIIEDMVVSIGKLLKTFVKAQVIILIVISIVCIAGFYVIGCKNPVSLGFITGFLDMLPFIGTGIVIVPMAIWALIQGQYFAALSYITLYIICAAARELLEPKLIGEKIGIYPIAILASVYIGIQLYGIAGILLGPLSLLLIKEIFQKMIFSKEEITKPSSSM